MYERLWKGSLQFSLLGYNILVTWVKFYDSWNKIDYIPLIDTVVLLYYRVQNKLTGQDGRPYRRLWLLGAPRY